MSRYAAKVEDGLVTQVIRGDKAWAESRLGGVWVASEEKVGRGWGWTKTYGLRPPRPYRSWKWVDSSWQAPVPRPDGDGWVWDESSRSWVEGELT